MPMRVPADAKVVRNQNLTLIRVLKTLNEKDCKELVDQAKKAMTAKDANYGESDLVNARLQAGSELGPIDAAALFKLTNPKSKVRLTVDQFLRCVTVKKEPLKEFLSQSQIDNLSSKVEDPEPSLITEFKEGVTFSSSHILQLIHMYVGSAQVPDQARSELSEP